MKTKLFLFLLVGGISIIPSFSSAEGDVDCSGRTSENCASTLCEWDTASKFCIPKENDLGEVTITACADKTKKYNPETEQCEPQTDPTSQTNTADEKAECLSQVCKVRDNKKNTCSNAGIKLNTFVPFIGNCIILGTRTGTGYSYSNEGTIIKEVNPTNAFPTLIGALMRILVSAMLIVGFLMILIAGVMITSGGISGDNYKKGRSMIRNVGSALALLGLMGVILKLINPTFFN